MRKRRKRLLQFIRLTIDLVSIWKKETKLWRGRIQIIIFEWVIYHVRLENLSSKKSFSSTWTLVLPNPINFLGIKGNQAFFHESRNVVFSWLAHGQNRNGKIVLGKIKHTYVSGHTRSLPHTVQSNKHRNNSGFHHTCVVYTTKLFIFFILFPLYIGGGVLSINGSGPISGRKKRDLDVRKGGKG